MINKMKKKDFIPSLASQISIYLMTILLNNCFNVKTMCVYGSIDTMWTRRNPPEDPGEPPRLSLRPPPVTQR